MAHIPSDNIFSVAETDFFDVSAFTLYLGRADIPYTYRMDTFASDVVCKAVFDPSGGYFIIASETKNAVVTFSKYYWAMGAYNPSGSGQIDITTGSYLYDGRTVYYYYGYNFNVDGYQTYRASEPECTAVTNGNNTIVRQYAWLMIYGGYLDGYDVSYQLTKCTGDSGNPTIIPPAAAVTNMRFTPVGENYFTNSSVSIAGMGYPVGPVQFNFDPATGELRVGPIASEIVVIVTASGADPYSEVDGEGPLPGGADVDLPAEPVLSALDAGLFALFSPSASQMRSLASFLWTDFGGSGTDVVQVLGEVVEALKRTVSNPLNSMLGLSIIASQGLSKGGSSNVHVGFWDTGVAMTKLAKQYFTVDCGSISFNPVCGDTFLDYAPYSKFSIFLPYVGTKELDANDVVGHTLSVKYRGDCVTGSLVCYLKRDGTIIAEFSGNCALNLPLTADSWGQTLAGAGAIVAGGVRGAVTGGATAAGGAVKAAASVATNPSVFSSQVTYTGAVSGGAGHMGSQKPFILREAVRFHSTSHFNSVIGYPAFYYKKLGDCSGYTQVLDVHLHNTPCTGAELKEIEDLLKEGVII